MNSHFRILNNGKTNLTNTPRKEKNIIQIWQEIGENVPFAVRNYRWSDQYYTIVEKVEIGKWPYGYAYGYPTINGQYSDHYERNKEWREKRWIPLAGCYQWTFVENAIISRNFTVLNTEVSLKKNEGRLGSARRKKPGAYSFNEIHADYPNAYAKWSTEDDEKLKELFKSGKTTEELAHVFQRKIGAVESRLVKLGLKVAIA